MQSHWKFHFLARKPEIHLMNLLSNFRIKHLGSVLTFHIQCFCPSQTNLTHPCFISARGRMMTLGTFCGVLTKLLKDESLWTATNILSFKLGNRVQIWHCVQLCFKWGFYHECLQPALKLETRLLQHDQRSSSLSPHSDTAEDDAFPSFQPIIVLLCC